MNPTTQNTDQDKSVQIKLDPGYCTALNRERKAATRNILINGFVAVGNVVCDIFNNGRRRASTPSNIEIVDYCNGTEYRLLDVPLSVAPGAEPQFQLTIDLCLAVDANVSHEVYADLGVVCADYSDKEVEAICKDLTEKKADAFRAEVLRCHGLRVQAANLIKIGNDTIARIAAVRHLACASVKSGIKASIRVETQIIREAARAAHEHAKQEAAAKKTAEDAAAAEDLDVVGGVAAAA